MLRYVHQNKTPQGKGEHKMSIQMNEQRKQQVEMLIKFYNMQTGRSFKFSTESNQVCVFNAIERSNGDLVKLKNYVRDYAQEKGENNDLAECFDRFEVGVPTQETVRVEAKTFEEITEKPKEEKNEAVKKETGVDGALSVLAGVVAQVVSQQKQEEIASSIMAGVEQKVQDFIKKEYGGIERKIVTVVDGKKVELEGVQHEKFEQVVKFVANNEPVFLTGPAGCGKNVLCQQVAKALNLDFYFSNAVTQEYKITGFTDAMGVFHESQFYKAFKNGGLFMLDEMDASIPEVLVILNAAIANRYFDFPAPIGYVEAHPDFRVIAAGNTFGLGANYEYVGRNQLDMASLDRFALVKVDYDRRIEVNVANGNEELVDFAREFRKSARKSGVRTIVSYRAIGRMAKLEKLLGLEEVVETCLTKSLEVDDLSAIISNFEIENKYTKAVKKVKTRLAKESF